MYFFWRYTSSIQYFSIKSINSFLTVHELLEVPDTFTAVLFPNKSPVVYTFFRIALFEAVLNASVADFLV